MGCRTRGPSGVFHFSLPSVHQCLLALLLLANRGHGLIPSSHRSPSTPEDPIHDNTTYDPSDGDQQHPPVPANPKQTRWASAAYEYVHNINCKHVFFTTEKECRNLVRVPRSETNIYLADPTPFGKFQAVLPDRGLLKTGVHDAVLVVDPYPHANFGHLVVIFYLELGVDQERCANDEGLYLDGGECLTLALKKRCKNALQRRQRRRNFARRCEINMLPLVYLQNDLANKTQRLTCRSNIPGFSPCLVLRTVNETSALICNPIRDNTKRCETTHELIHTSCRVFEICDQAVLLSGGWNRWSSRMYHRDNVWEMFSMLRRHGYREKNIKVFFANGALGIPVTGDRGTDDSRTLHEVYPSAMKFAMRYHLQRLCTSPHCADSLLLYLNSPSLSDGTSLLWDINGDGQASTNEMYTLKELMHDLAGCEARQVHIIADQSYSGELVRAFRRSHTHNNVVVYASSRDNEYSYGTEYTKIWTLSNHTNVCMKEIQKEAKKTLRFSTPESSTGEESASSNIFGAPCDMVPAFTHRELRQNYLGCQNLPTAMWVSRFAREQRYHHYDTNSPDFLEIHRSSLQSSEKTRNRRSVNAWSKSGR